MYNLFALFSLCICLLFPAQAAANGRRYKRSGASSALRDTRAKQKQQNRAANRYDLSRIEDRSELEKFIAMAGPRRLVAVSDTDSYYLDPDIGYLDPGYEHLYRHARVWVKLFLDTELTEARRVTGDRFKIASLVRPRSYQEKLSRRKSGAIFGKRWWEQSSHMTGATVDISFKGLSVAGQRWLRQRLKKLQAQGQIIAVEERYSGHFHVMVLPSYK